MKKFKTYSAQYKIIQPRKNNPNPQCSTPNPQIFANKNPEGEKWRSPHKKILSQDRQAFINNISASGYKQFNL